MKVPLQWCEDIRAILKKNITKGNAIKQIKEYMDLKEKELNKRLGYGDDD